MTDREFDIHEMLWNCEMARLWLENHWKHLGKGYDLSYKQREKEAEWHIDFALLVANNADWSEGAKEMTSQIHRRHRINPESYQREMYK